MFVADGGGGETTGVIKEKGEKMSPFLSGMVRTGPGKACGEESAGASFKVLAAGEADEALAADKGDKAGAADDEGDNAGAAADEGDNAGTAADETGTDGTAAAAALAAWNLSTGSLLRA